MTTLADIAAAPNTTALPGYVLSPPRLREWGAAEAQAARDHMALVRDSLAGMPADIVKDVMGRALELVKGGEFGVGSPHLDSYLQRAESAPFVLWLCLQQKHPQVTREQALNIMTPEVEADAFRAALELFGLMPDWSKKNDQTSEPPPAPTGGESSKPSEASEE